MTTREDLTLLLVEDSDIDARRIETLLRYSEHASCALYRVASFSAALSAVKQRNPDVVLLDLGLPDVMDMDGIASLTSKYPDLAIVVLTGHEDFQSGLSAIRSGAQEYILKGDVSSETLERAILHARERKRIARKQTKLYKESLRSLVPDAADAIAIQKQYTTLRSTLDRVRHKILAQAPSVVAEIDALIRENAALDDSSDEYAIPTTETVDHVAKSIVERYSSVPDAVSTDTVSDPRSILSDVLTRYAPRVEVRTTYGPR